MWCRASTEAVEERVRGVEERARVVEERVRVAMGWEEAVTALGVEARAGAVVARAVAEMARAVVAWAVAARAEEGMASEAEATGWVAAAKATVVVATARAEAVTETVAAAMGGAERMGRCADLGCRRQYRTGWKNAATNRLSPAPLPRCSSSSRVHRLCSLHRLWLGVASRRCRSDCRMNCK